MEFESIELRIENRILTISLNRPDALNAFTVKMADELERAFKQASEDDAVGAIIVTGAGKAFCAGMDLSTEGNVFGLNESLTPTLDGIRNQYTQPEIVNGVRDTGGRVTLAIYECKKPVIAAINGAAVGIGATMTLAMDIRLASEKARMGFVFGKLGVTPEACSTWFLPRLVGLQTTLEWIYSGEILEPAKLVSSGLVRSVHSPESLLQEAKKLAQKFIENRSSVGIALARQMIYRNCSLPSPKEAHEVESISMFYTSLEDGKEGVASFLEKRSPNFKTKASEMPPFYPWS